MRASSAFLLALSTLALCSTAFAGADELSGGQSASWGKLHAGNPAPASTELPPEGAAPGAAPAAPAAPKGASVTGGYSYSDGPGAAAVHVFRPKYRKTGPVVQLPGFEATADGGSRVFVQLSETVPIEERRAGSTITYVLKGASPRVWNNTNPLVTVHFDTPVSQARLVPRGKDVHLVIDLRAVAAPTFKTTETKDKGVMLIVDFPKGDYLSPAAAAAAKEAAKDTKATAKPKAGGKGKPAKPAPPPSAPPPPSGPKP